MPSTVLQFANLGANSLNRIRTHGLRNEVCWRIVRFFACRSRSHIGNRKEEEVHLFLHTQCQRHGESTVWPRLPFLDMGLIPSSAERMVAGNNTKFVHV